MSARAQSILIIIPYGIGIEFAIGRLITAFFEMAVRLTGDPSRVHFAFRELGEGRSPVLPSTFRNFTEFDMSASGGATVKNLVDYVRRHDITAVFALDMPVSARYLRALRRAGVRKVISYWGAPMGAVSSAVKLALKRAEVALVWRAKPDHFIFESIAMQRFAVRGRGLPLRRTSVVPTGVDTNVFRVIPDARDLVYSRFAIPRNRRIIVYMGHLHERKGVSVLMDAAVHLTRGLGRDDVHFLFLGDRPGETERFRKHFEGAQSHITFGGYQAGIPSLLAGCFAGCVPSNGWDSFPMSSLEMQACGLPVFASDWQGVPETVRDGETGIVVPAGNPSLLAEAIASLVDDPARHRRMAEAARTRIANELTREVQIENLVRCVGAELER